MYLQRDNQWFIAGVTTGAVGGVGFVDADVSTVYDWIVSETGINFSAQAAPVELTFDANFTQDGVQTTSPTGFSRVWDTTNPLFTGGADGFNYTWENDFATTAVFGTSTTAPTVVPVSDTIIYGGIRFDATDPNATPGPFQLTDGGGTLRTQNGGAVIETNRFSAISANLVGAGLQSITKTGAADLLLTGDNSGFDSEIFINAGTLIVSSGTALGTGGFVGSKKTTVADGATFQLRGTGATLAEHFHINGSGDDGKGAIYVSGGDHLLTERIAVRSNSVVNVEDGNSLTIGGDNGQFYSPSGESFTLSQSGDGTVIYDNVGNIAGLNIYNGTAGGVGGITGVRYAGWRRRAKTGRHSFRRRDRNVSDRRRVAAIEQPADARSRSEFGDCRFAGRRRHGGNSRVVESESTRRTDRWPIISNRGQRSRRLCHRSLF